MVVRQAVVDVPPVAPMRHEPGIPQHPQLVTDGRLRHVERVHDLVHTDLAVSQQAQNAEPRRVGEALEQLHRGRHHRRVRQIIFQCDIAVAVRVERIRHGERRGCVEE
jgi:hypothetical protein